MDCLAFLVSLLGYFIFRKHGSMLFGKFCNSVHGALGCFHMNCDSVSLCTDIVKAHYWTKQDLDWVVLSGAKPGALKLGPH